MTPFARVADIVALYDARGGELYGEDVTQREHAVQTAALAQAAGAAPALVAAALLHDIGHLLGAGESLDSDDRHELHGARALRPLFGPAVRGPIVLHVAAKRYLCAVDAGYVSGLSDASRRSLALQGGAFDADEAARFRRRPYAADAVALRRFDDDGKSATAAEVPFAAFVPALEALARR